MNYEGAEENTSVRRRSNSSVPAPAKNSEAPSTPPKASNDSGDSTLSRYFRDMATHQVMGPDEELKAAQDVEASEVGFWVALLSYLPVAETLLVSLEEDLDGLNPEERPQTPEFEGLRDLLNVYRTQRSKLHAGQQKKWQECCEGLARAIYQ